MSRWIEVEPLIDLSISVLCGGGNEEMAVLVEDIDSEPSITIVRCRECRWLRYCETEEMESFLDCDHPNGGGIPRSEEWFCADGERSAQ